MSTETAGFVPGWTLGWRMQRALSHAGMTTNEAADELGVSRSTISRWVNDRGAPKRAFLLQLAFMTGVNVQWLETGEAPQPTDPGGGAEVNSARIGALGPTLE